MTATLFSFSCMISLCGQDFVKVKVNDTTLVNTIKFKGGNEEYSEFIQKHLEYPDDMLESGIDGDVVVSIKVDSVGNLTSKEVMASPHQGYSKEALRVIDLTDSMWIPGSDINGKYLDLEQYVVIRFYDRTYEGVRKHNLNYTYNEDLKEASQFLEQGKFEDARKNLTLLYRADPQNADVLVARAYAYIGLKNSKAACKDLKRAIKLGNEKAQTLLQEHCSD